MTSSRALSGIKQPRAQKTGAKSMRFATRLSPEQKALFERAAAIYNQPVSQFVISSAQRAAEQQSASMRC